MDVIGEELFYSFCIADLYDLVKARRADNLKEALNKYDDEKYKARMQEMQQATQHAAEISAQEARRHSQQLESIERDTAQIRRNTGSIKRDTAQIRRSTRDR